MTDETVVGGADSMNVDTHIESEPLKVVEEVATEEKGMVVAGNESMEAAAPGGMGEDSEKEEEARAGMEAAAGDKKEGTTEGSDTTRVWGQGASKGEGDEEGEGGSDSEGAASGEDDAGDKGEESSEAEEIPLVVVVGRTPSEEKSAGDGEDEDVIVVEKKNR